jgi:hypothetical protein
MKGDLRINLAGILSKTSDLGTPKFDINIDEVMRVTQGTGAKQADKMVADTRTIAASSNDDLDLAGSLLDPFGVAAVFAEVMAIFVRASAANTNNVVIGGHDTAAFVGPFGDASDKIVLKPGASIMIMDPTATGWAVTATTADILRLANSGAGSTVSYDIVILGRSA